MSRVTELAYLSLHFWINCTQLQSISSGNKVVNPPQPAAPNTTLCLCSSVPRLRIMFSSAGALSDDQSSTQTERGVYTVSTSQQFESITQQPLAGISWLSYNVLNCERDWKSMAGQFMVHCILQLKSTFKSEMYIHPGLVPLFSVWFCLFVCLFFFALFVLHVLFNMQ